MVEISVMNSPRTAIDDTARAFIFDQDAHALQWIRGTSLKGPRVFADDYGSNMVTTLTAPEPRYYQESVLRSTEDTILYENIFLSVMNQYTDSFKDAYGPEVPISTINRVLSQKNKIFENGAVIYAEKIG